MRFGLKFAWYDLWIGAFWDQKGVLYVCPIPMVVLTFDFRKLCPRCSHLLCICRIESQREPDLS
jgi:hypothetical protein